VFRCQKQFTCEGLKEPAKAVRKEKIK